MAGLGLWKHPACSDSVLAGTPPNLGGFYPAPALTAKAIFHPNFIFFHPPWSRWVHDAKVGVYAVTKSSQYCSN